VSKIVKETSIAFRINPYSDRERQPSYEYEYDPGSLDPSLYSRHFNSQRLGLLAKGQLAYLSCPFFNRARAKRPRILLNYEELSRILFLEGLE
ncbi:MAG: hypothetical protein ACREP8_17630, partial [Candidatus Binatia bacterium]